MRTRMKVLGAIGALVLGVSVARADIWLAMTLITAIDDAAEEACDYVYPQCWVDFYEERGEYYDVWWADSYALPCSAFGGCPQKEDALYTYDLVRDHCWELYAVWNSG
jgi:hypothetical protein